MKYRFRAFVFLIISALISGIAGPVIKLTLKNVPVDTFLFYRFFISSVIVILLLPFAKLKIPKKPSILLNFILYGFLNSTVALGFLFLGANKTTLLNWSLITLISPILTILAGYIMLHDRISRKLKMGILITFLGAFIILIGPFITTGDNVGEVSGNIFVVISMIAGAASTIIVKNLLRQGEDPLSLSNFSWVIGFFSFLIIILFNGKLVNTFETIQSLPIQYHLGVLYMAIFSGSIAYYLGNSAQKTLSVSEAAVFGYVPSVISAILAVILLGDAITVYVIIGTIITFAGVYLAETRHKVV
ncbi:MAG TPA: DMT family transporter [Patescibacteria group bacterium]|nr:DMT family transporter [Patescibacteria group bacterium]